MTVEIVVSMHVAKIVRVAMLMAVMMVMVVVIWAVRIISMMMVVMIREPVFASITPHQENRAQALSLIHI